MVMALSCMAALGAAVGLVVSIRIARGGALTQGLSLYDIWVVCSGAAGGAAGLWSMRHRMGQPGLAGLRHAAIGVAGISFVGPLIGGTLALPIYGTMFGPFTLAVILIGAPILGLFWLYYMCMVHVLLLNWTAERDSIFRVTEAADALRVRRRRDGAISLRP